VGWVAALLTGLLGWVLARDVRRRETALAMLYAHRDDQPGPYWAIMGFWAICLLFCALLALAAYLADDICEGQDPCNITVEVRTA
jgi:hypothetical protein